MPIEVDPKDLEYLVKIRTWEEEASEEDMRLGWEWDQVGVPMPTINRFITMGMVERTYKSRSSKCHKLTEKAKTIMNGEPAASEEVREISHEPVGDELYHMFDDIEGYDDTKELLIESLQLDKPIHTLLVGPPAIAKTMFLFDIEKAFGSEAEWFLGSGTSRVGMWERIIEARPRILLIDEFDKMKPTDYAALLSLMEKGRVTISKHRRHIDFQHDVWVIAAANRISGMSVELLSRFKQKNFVEYSAKEFMKVVEATLIKHENVDARTASVISLKLVGKTHNVRDAIRVARLATRVGVDRAVQLIIED